MAFEILGEVLIRLDVVVVRTVSVTDDESLVAFAPIVLILALIVISRFRDSGFEEIREAEHRRRRREAAAGVTPDAGARQIDERILLRQVLHAGDLVRYRVVAAHRAV